MPPRWLRLVILAAWLVLTGWLFWHELLPQLLPGQPPPYSIDLVEEARTNRVATTWTLYQDGREVCFAKTRIEHPRRDRFLMIADYPIKGYDFHASLAAGVVGVRSENALTTLVMAACVARTRPPGGVTTGRVAAVGIQVHALTTSYLLNSDGDLLGFEARFQATSAALAEFALADLTGTLSGKFDAVVSGAIQGSRLTLTHEVMPAVGKPLRGVGLAEPAVGRGGAVLLPLHPVKQMRGLRPGQTWRAVVVNPLAILPAGEPRVVRARVRPAVEPFGRGRTNEVPCLVVDYEGDRVKVSVWVSRDDSSVVAQEATLDRTTWAMVRHH